MKILFSHGKESGPWGTKISHLAQIARAQDIALDSIDYTDSMDPDVRAARLVELVQAEPNENFILVGSSMGGYVSMVAGEQPNVIGLFLMAPALYIPGYAMQYYAPTPKCIHIVHGWQDEIIPHELSVRFARRHECSLHLIEGNHRLDSSMGDLGRLFKLFLAEIWDEVVA